MDRKVGGRWLTFVSSPREGEGEGETPRAAVYSIRKDEDEDEDEGEQLVVVVMDEEENAQVQIRPAAVVNRERARRGTAIVTSTRDRSRHLPFSCMWVWHGSAENGLARSECLEACRDPQGSGAER